MYQHPYMNCNMMYDMQAFKKALELIKKAVQDEKEDELFYDYLISIAPTKEEKKIIETIRNDERKHNNYFKKIYKQLTGMSIKSTEEKEFNKPESYIEGIKKALFGELKAVEKYREIRKGLPTRYYRDILFEIITDELKHGIKYNYILNLNNKEEEKCRALENSNNSNKIDPNDWVKYATPLIDCCLIEVSNRLKNFIEGYAKK